MDGRVDRFESLWSSLVDGGRSGERLAIVLMSIVLHVSVVDSVSIMRLLAERAPWIQAYPK